MKEIKCPNCNKVFQVDEAGYAAIVKQVRDEEFSAELKSREENFKKEKEGALELEKARSAEALQKSLAEKNDEIQKLKSKIETDEADKKLAVSEMAAQKEREIAELKSQLALKETEKQLALNEAMSAKDRQLSQKQQEIALLSSQAQSAEKDYETKQAALKAGYEQQLRLKDEEIERIKDFKARQSTKMIGESLEQHCETEFNKLRATGFKNAYFEKDNDARTGSKGDYIFREYDENGIEIISIMFEMKNEADTTATKHKNEDFFRELDKDRTEKQCEYAVLVTMLEADSELYNTGIVDVSHRYEKMYVVRPQFFIPIITLLRNAALNSLEYKQELAVMRNQNIDIADFEDNLMKFKEGFAYNYEQAHKRFDEAISEIDKSITHLQKIKDALTKSDNQLRIANNKVDEITIKKLTRGNPTMAQRFAELRSDK